VRLEKLPEFDSWLGGIQDKQRALVEARLFRLETHDHFGDAKNIGDSLAELRWANGMRVYFTRRIDAQGNIVILLLGGFKNGQKKDIKQARLLLKQYQASPTQKGSHP